MARTTSHARAGPAPGPDPGATPAGKKPGARVNALGNLARQALAGADTAPGQWKLGSPFDAAERDAERVAGAALSGAASGRPAAPAAVPAAIGNGPALGAARPLTRDERHFFEPRFGADLGAVRIHDNAQAAANAAALGARAFSLGSQIAFGAGEYAQGSEAGRRLLAHELAHVLQPGDATTSRRQPLASGVPSGPMCTAQPGNEAEQTAEPQMCMAPAKQDPANPTVLNLTGTLDARVASFKSLVKTTAIHRLMDNRTNLDAWAALVETEIPTGDLAAMGLMQMGGTGPYFDLQEMRDPQMRELRAAQSLGQFRACTGCHLEKEISASRGERESMDLGGWSAPNELRSGFKPASRFSLFPAGQPSSADLHDLMQYGFGEKALPAAKPGPTGPAAYQPPAGSQEARLHDMFPDPAATRSALQRAAPIMTALGPEGYKVLPGDLLSRLETTSSSKVRDAILAAIKERQGNYLELIGKIRDGEVGYEFFGPVVKKLMPLADAEVQQAIQDEMDTKRFWDRVEQVVVAAMTALALLLAIFPPTTALGIAFFASLELSLGYYGVTKGNEAMRLGSAFQLGVGAHDVFTLEQQEQADAMVMMGFVSAATGWLGIAGGLARTASAASHFVPPPTAGTSSALAESTALAKTGGTGVARTVQQGEYVMTIAEDGAMVVTASSRPDLLIMVRGETATLYQLLEGGGMRVVSRATLPRGGPASTPAPLQLGAPSPGGPIITPAPPVRPQLTVGQPTTYSWEQISKMKQPQLWEQREIYMQEIYGAAGQQHFPIPGTGGRHVDVPLQYGGGQFYFAGEVKSYSLWIGVKGQKGGILNEVGLSERIQTQINRDIWLRDNVPGFDPRWMFTDAPPSEALRQALRDARIVFIEYLR